MQLLSEISITSNEKQSVVQLLKGDLSALPKEHAVDILVVSAFPNSYVPLPGTLFQALYNKGLSMEKLANNNEINLLSSLGCWLSEPLTTEQRRQFNFKKVLCFEPRYHSSEPQTVVGNIFRCINTFAFDEENDEIAMPVLATGNQMVSIKKMLPALLENAVFWLQNGLPLKCIKLVVYREDQVAEALSLFNLVKQKIEKKEYREVKNITEAFPVKPKEMISPALPEKQLSVNTREEIGDIQPKSTTEEPFQPHVQASAVYDLFISYSHKQTEAVGEFVKALLKKNSKLNLFYDRNSIPTGGMWLRMISDAIQHSNAVLCILTPEYSKSDVCWDEFQCAKVMEQRTKKNIIKTINFIKDDEMPPLFAIYSYIDRTEADLQKLINCADQFS